MARSKNTVVDLCPLADDPRLALERDKLDGLLERQAALDALVRPNGIPAPLMKEVAIQALALLDGEDCERVRQARALAEAQATLPAVVAAVAEQRQRVSSLRDQLSREACQACEPEHRALLLAVVQAAGTLQAAVEAEADFRERVTGLGYSGTYLAPTRPSVTMAAALNQIKTALAGIG
jgi:hypothetical protein